MPGCMRFPSWLRKSRKEHKCTCCEVHRAVTQEPEPATRPLPEVREKPWITLRWLDILRDLTCENFGVIAKEDLKELTHEELYDRCLYPFQQSVGYNNRYDARRIGRIRLSATMLDPKSGTNEYVDITECSAETWRRIVDADIICDLWMSVVVGPHAPGQRRPRGRLIAPVKASRKTAEQQTQTDEDTVEDEDLPK